MNDDSESSNGNGQERSDGGNWFRRLGKSIAGGPRNRGDILEFLGEASSEGLIEGEALPMIEGVLETADLQARDIMIPRAQMVVLEDDWTLDQVLEAVVESGHSRFPVVGHSRDEIVGILLATRSSGAPPSWTATADWTAFYRQFPKPIAELWGQVLWLDAAGPQIDWSVVFGDATTHCKEL